MEATFLAGKAHLGVGSTHFLHLLLFSIGFESELDHVDNSHYLYRDRR